MTTQSQQQERPQPRIVKFYETTLRDGEQTPGVNYFPKRS